VSPAADANTTTVQVWVDVPNPGERLKPGTSVHAVIVSEQFKAATVIPAAAILPGEEGGTAVLTVGSDSTVRRKTVKLGVREGNQVQILAGVSPGEEVVVVGGLGLDDKAKVKVVTTQVEEADDEDEDNAPPEPKASKAPQDQKKDEAKPKGK
jgi:RND family efflux transporter MFP subunit